MLVSFQSFELPEIGAYRRFWGIAAPGIWVHVVEMCRLGADEGLVTQLGFGRPSGVRNLFGMGLGGRSFLRDGAGRVHEYREGSALLLPGRSALQAMHSGGDASFSINIETDLRRFGAQPFLPTLDRLPRPDRVRARVEALCAAVEAVWAGSETTTSGALPTAFDDLFAVLLAEGAPLPPIRACDLDPFPPSLQGVARAVDQSLSRVGVRPVMVDVEAGVEASARTVQRLFPALCEAWGQRPETFRQHRQRILAWRACAAMANARATTSGVARALGFSTPNAFCRFVARSGLPCPGAVRERVQASLGA